MAKSGKKYQVAVVGCGHIGALFEAQPKRQKPASHAGAVRANGRTKLVALVDTNKNNLSAACKLFPGTTGYTSLAECLKTERLDMIIIATPPFARFALLKQCVQAHIPMIVCEKPLATNVRKANQIEALVARSRVTFVLNYQRRFSPLFARVRADIKKGKLGRIQQITCYYSNGLYSNGGHIIDALSYIMNDNIASVIGSKNVTNKTHPAGDVNADALLTTKKGTLIALQSFDQKKYGIHDIRIYGTKGNAILSDYGMSLAETPARASSFVGIQQLDSTYQHSIRAPLSATKDALAHAIECYEKHRVPASSAVNGVLDLQILDAIAESARNGGRKVLV